MNRWMTQYLVCDARTMAMCRRGFPRGTTIQPDRGSQYSSQRYQQLLRSLRLCGSMGRKATCDDKAVTEKFFHTQKVELIHRERYDTRHLAKSSTFEYIEIYDNRQRKHSAIEHRLPMVCEQPA